MKYADIEWRDGQPYSASYDDIYFSTEGGREESEYVFIKQNHLPGAWRNSSQFIIAETGFGTGLNFVLTLKHWLETATDDAVLHYIGIEKHPVSPGDIRRLSETWPDLAEYFEALLAVYPLPVEGVHARTIFNGRVYLHLHFMDVLDALNHQRFNVNAWYLDGFGPAKNPDLWSTQVFLLIAQNSRLGATLATYTCAGFVKRGLESAGFIVDKVKGHGKKREMIAARMERDSDYQSPAPWFELPVSKVKNRTITVIGAGLAGLSVAWSFVQRGWQVTLVDKHSSVAQEASGNLAGLVLPRLSIDNQHESMFYTSAFLLALRNLQVLQKNTKEQFWFDSGVYSVFKPGKARSLIERYEYPELFMHVQEQEGVPGYLNTGASDLAYLSIAGWAMPGRICEAIVCQCGDNLSIVTAEADRLNQIDGGWQVLSVDDSIISESEVVVLANAARVKDFDQLSWLPVSSVRGQVTEIKSSANSKKLKQAFSFDAYVTPEHNGVHYAGASYNLQDKSYSLDVAEQNENLARLNAVLPGMFELPETLTGRVGFRAVSEDRMPVAGAVPDADVFSEMYSDLYHGKPAENYPDGEYLTGLYVSTAHGSRGMTSCFLSAEIIAAMANKEPLPASKVIIDMLNPARFIIRKLKRSRYQDQ